MRSSKSRSRNKSNRNNNVNRSAVNLVNRVFDSSGPEGKVRGTPQQIIEKYSQLARDAQLSNDRVAAENFQQHAEHYLRMLGEAQREIDARRDQDMAQQAQRDRQQGGGGGGGGGNQQNTSQQGGGDQPEPQQPRNEPAAPEQPQDPAPEGGTPARERRPRAPRAEKPPRDADQPSKTPAPQDDVIDTGSESDSGLVETPESKPSKPRRSRSKPRPDKSDGGDQGSGNSEAAE